MKRKEIYLAGGCFWGLEKYLGNIPGVLETEVGYANGKTKQPTYEEVCRKNTGHAETVRVAFDREQLSLAGLLSLYYKVINPTSLNRQGNDVGSQYRTGIYYMDLEDLPVIQSSLEQLQREHVKKIAVEVKPLQNYWPAEEYHQNYLDKNPGGYCHIPGHYFEEAKHSSDPFLNPLPDKEELKEQLSLPDKEELKEQLNSIQYEVTMKNGTEPPYQNEYWDHFEEGIYVDITTGEPLFTSFDKFEACGWPSFSKAISSESVRTKRDFSHGMIRDEVRSGAGDIHLGHVFEDGPKEKGGLRYCINSAALRFIPKEKLADEGYGQYLELFTARS